MLRFQADANLNEIIVRAVRRREPSVDFQTAQVAGLSGIVDPEVLARAAQEDRVLVTHDFQTMPQHFATFIMTQQSPGLLLIPQHLAIASAVEDLWLIWSTMEPEEWVNLIWYLPL